MTLRIETVLWPQVGFARDIQYGDTRLVCLAFLACFALFLFLSHIDLKLLLGKYTVRTLFDCLTLRAPAVSYCKHEEAGGLANAGAPPAEAVSERPISQIYSELTLSIFYVSYCHF